jgi:glycosyltransferase involved in cell wall biosynthesis
MKLYNAAASVEQNALQTELEAICTAEQFETAIALLRTLDWTKLMRLAQILPAPIRSNNLVGIRCSEATPVRHAKELHTLRLGGGATGLPAHIALAKAVYHARWLSFLFSGGDDAALPLVSIIIPTYNRAKFCRDAVESCLTQTYPKIEVIVVDDGSTDDIVEVLSPFQQRIAVYKKPNGGVSSARNLGVSLARGEFIHFLDSDNLLLPDCVGLKVRAFGTIADADLCYNLAVTYDPSSLGLSLADLPEPNDGPASPTTSLFNSWFPAYVSSMMMPRHVALENDPFDESLPRAEDTRYWFRLAFRKRKAIAIREVLLERRRVEGALSLDRRIHVLYDHITLLLNLIDLLQEPKYWPHVLGKFLIARELDAWSRIILANDDRIAGLRQDLVIAVNSLLVRGSTSGFSPILPAMCCLAAILYLDAMGHTGEESNPFRRQIEKSLLDVIQRASELTSADRTLWLQSRGAGQHASSALSFLRPWLRSKFDNHAFDGTLEFLKTWALASSDREDAEILLSVSPSTARARRRFLGYFFRRTSKIASEPAFELLNKTLSLTGWPGLRAVWEDHGAVDMLRATAENVQSDHDTGKAAVIGKGTDMAPASWHYQQLLCAVDPDNFSPLYLSSYLRKVKYHAVMLRHLLAPETRAYLPVVAVVIPAHNRAWIISETIAACRAQTYPAVRIIVSDDGSTDGLDAVVQNLGSVTYLRRRCRRGVSAARNHALTMYHAPFIYFLDSDDLISPTAIKDHVELYRAFPDLAFSYSLHSSFDHREGGRSDPYPTPWADAPMVEPTTNLSLSLSAGFVPQLGAYMMPQHRALAAGLFDEWLKRCEDQRFLFRYSLGKPRVARIEKRLMQRRVMKDSLWTSRPSDYTDFATVLLHNIMDVLPLPTEWFCLYWLLQRMIVEDKWTKINLSNDRFLDRARRLLLQQIRNLGTAGSIGEISTAVPCALLLAGLVPLQPLVPSSVKFAGSFHNAMQTEILEASRKATVVREITLDQILRMPASNVKAQLAAHLLSARSYVHSSRDQSLVQAIDVVLQAIA